MSDFTERYLSLAEDCGFDHASPLDVSTLQVETWVRDTCAEDKCHAYNHTTTGPVPRPAGHSKSVKRR